MDDIPARLQVEDASELSDSDILFFRDNPRLLNTIGDREQANLVILKRVLIAAVVLVVSSKLIAFNFGDEISRFLNEVVVDLLFELGAALLGAAATVYFVELQQKRQFEANLKLREDIERRIAELDEDVVSG